MIGYLLSFVVGGVLATMLWVHVDKLCIRCGFRLSQHHVFDQRCPVYRSDPAGPRFAPACSCCGKAGKR